MKRGLVILALALGVTSRAAAQWAGLPVWNNPKGGTGVTISGDYCKPNNASGGGNAFGARASLGQARKLHGGQAPQAGVDGHSAGRGQRELSTRAKPDMLHRAGFNRQMLWRNIGLRQSLG